MMRVAIWDTYVQKRDGKIMHFDIVVPVGIIDESSIHAMGKKYLITKGEQDQELTSRQCQYCHQEIAGSEMQLAIKQQGYYIIEMEGCV